MNKYLLLAIVAAMLFTFTGCAKLFSKRYVTYTVTNGQGSYSGKTAYISYINEDGENEFDEVAPGMTWSWSGDFKADDWVRVQANCDGTTGYIKVSVDCDDGDNDKITEQIDLSVRNIVEASMSLN